MQIKFPYISELTPTEYEAFFVCATRLEQIRISARNESTELRKLKARARKRAEHRAKIKVKTTST